MGRSTIRVQPAERKTRPTSTSRPTRGGEEAERRLAGYPGEQGAPDKERHLESRRAGFKVSITVPTAAPTNTKPAHERA